MARGDRRRFGAGDRIGILVEAPARVVAGRLFHHFSQETRMDLASKVLRVAGAWGLCYAVALAPLFAQSPGNDYRCFTFSANLGGQPCRCPVGKGGVGEIIDHCEGARPVQTPTQDGELQISDDMIYVPACMAYQDCYSPCPACQQVTCNCVSSPPAVPCGTVIWRCVGICCDGSCYGGNPNGCNITNKTEGCSNLGSYGCAGAYAPTYPKGCPKCED